LKRAYAIAGSYRITHEDFQRIKTCVCAVVSGHIFWMVVCTISYTEYVH